MRTVAIARKVDIAFHYSPLTNLLSNSASGLGGKGGKLAVYFLGVDIGTYSSKGVLVRQNGTAVACHVVPDALSTPRLVLALLRGDLVVEGVRYWHKLIATCRSFWSVAF